MTSKSSASSYGSRKPRTIVRRGNGAELKNDTLDVAALARVSVTSEQALYPIDNVFDEQSGPGGSCWVASTPGAQVVTLSFEQPIDLRTVHVESEERGDTRTQEIELALSVDGGATYTPEPLRAFGFTPYGPSFHEGTWQLGARAVTHLRLSVTPTPRIRLASLTSVVLR